METAEIRIDKNIKGKNISAYYYYFLSDEEKGKIKEFLVCDECQGKAFFRTKTKDGKSECFYANHKQGCENSSSSSGKDGENEENTEVIEVSDCLEISFVDYSEYRKDDEIEDIEAYNIDDTGKKDEANKTKRHIKYPEKSINQKISIKTILNYAEKGILEQEKFIVELDKYKYNLKKITHNANNPSEYRQYINKKHFYWGIIESTDSKTWLNFSKDEINKLSIKIDEKISKKFFKRFKMDSKKLKNIRLPIICYGFLNIGKSGKLYITIKNLKEIYAKMSKVEILD